MKQIEDITKISSLIKIIKLIIIASIAGIFAGIASYIFFVSLELVTAWREAHAWIIMLLPLCGLLIGLLYYYFGQNVEQGINLLISEIHEPEKIIQFRMTPLVLFGTLATHLFGGSAGREGTAIQMGGSLADQLTRPFGLTDAERRILIMSGISAGFASLFGTPLAGAIFALEFITIGEILYDAILPCFISAIIGDQVSLFLGIHHTKYLISYIPEISFSGVISAVLAGIAFGIISMIYSNATHGISNLFKKIISYPPLRPCFGGALLTVSIWAIGTARYAGLGIPVIKEAFNSATLPFDFAWKVAFTALTLGSGFKGGEVTSLFFIGATLGNTLSSFLFLPAPLLAGLGLVSIFAGAANVPIAAIIMAIEIFGLKISIYAAIACAISYMFSGHRGIYTSQRIGSDKYKII